MLLALSVPKKRATTPPATSARLEYHHAPSAPAIPVSSCGEVGGARALGRSDRSIRTHLDLADHMGVRWTRWVRAADFKGACLVPLSIEYRTGGFPLPITTAVLIRRSCRSRYRNRVDARPSNRQPRPVPDLRLRPPLQQETLPRMRHAHRTQAGVESRHASPASAIPHPTNREVGRARGVLVDTALMGR